MTRERRAGDRRERQHVRQSWAVMALNGNVRLCLTSAFLRLPSFLCGLLERRRAAWCLAQWKLARRSEPDSLAETPAFMPSLSLSLDPLLHPSRTP